MKCAQSVFVIARIFQRTFIPRVEYLAEDRLDSLLSFHLFQKHMPGTEQSSLDNLNILPSSSLVVSQYLGSSAIGVRVQETLLCQAFRRSIIGKSTRNFITHCYRFSLSFT